MPPEITNARTAELQALVKNFRQVHQDWADADDRPDPDALYRAAALAVISGFAGDDIPADCQEMKQAVERFAAEHAGFVDSNNPHPEPAFFAAASGMFSLLTTLKYPELMPLEPLKKLRDQEVPDHQICKIYGLVDKLGRPMDWLIDAEIDKPGSVLATAGAIDGRTWEDPRATERKAKERAAAAAKQVAELPERKKDAKETHETPEAKETPCKESARELCRQKVSVAQAAKMLEQSEASVAKAFDFYAREAGLIRAFNQNKTAEVAAKELRLEAADVAEAFGTFELLQSEGQPLELGSPGLHLANARIERVS